MYYNTFSTRVLLVCTELFINSYGENCLCESKVWRGREEKSGTVRLVTLARMLGLAAPGIRRTHPQKRAPDVDSQKDCGQRPVRLPPGADSFNISASVTK